MKIIVLGAGVVGISTAYELQRRGHSVTVVEARKGVALAASYANGGQLSYSYVMPLASPGVIPKLPGWLLRSDSPVRFRPRLDPHQWWWGLQFLMACRKSRSDRSTHELLSLSALSRAGLHDLVKNEQIDFHFQPSGKLVLYSDLDALQGARRQVDLQKRLGCEQHVLSADACLALEPSLSHIRHRLTGGIHTPGEDSGDCHLFCNELRRLMSGPGTKVEFLFGATARQIIVTDRRFRAIVTDAGTLEADVLVLSLGAASRRLTRPLGFDLPLYPLKGYSLSIPIAKPDAAPRLSVTDLARKVVYARLGDHLRVAGMADIEGREPTFTPSRLGLLVRQTRATFPDFSDFERINPWCGLRPATPTGLPIIRRSPVADNFYLNTGQGALGFTLAMGSARIVSDLIDGKPASTSRPDEDASRLAA